MQWMGGKFCGQFGDEKDFMRAQTGAIVGFWGSGAPLIYVYGPRHGPKPGSGGPPGGGYSYAGVQAQTPQPVCLPTHQFAKSFECGGARLWLWRSQHGGGRRAVPLSVVQRYKGLQRKPLTGQSAARACSDAGSSPLRHHEARRRVHFWSVLLLLAGCLPNPKTAGLGLAPLDAYGVAHRPLTPGLL